MKESWNLRNVGEWDIKNNQAHPMSFRLDLTAYCTAAEPYEVAFVVRGGDYVEPVFSYDWANTGQWEDNIPPSQLVRVRDVNLWFAGAAANHYLYSNEHAPNRILFNLTGIPSELIIELEVPVLASLAGAKIEAYLLRK